MEKQEFKMKRKIAFLISIPILLGVMLTACAPTNNSSSVTNDSIPPGGEITQPDNSAATTLMPTEVNSPDLPISSIRVVVDGKVNVFNAALSESDWYLTPADIKTALGIETEATLGGYTNLRDVAKEANISYEHDGMLDAAYIWTDEVYDAYYSYDFVRAVDLNLVPENLKSDLDRQITSVEFRDLLSVLVNRLEPDKTAWFEENVTTYNKPLLRGEGFVMAYYAADCLGVNDPNNNFDHTKATEEDSDFWNTDVYQLENLFPHVWEGPVNFLTGAEWNDYRTAAFLWSLWYSSPYSGYQVFEYDEAAKSMRQNQPLTIREAAMAAVRMYDGYVETDQYVPAVEYVSLDDEKAIDMDRSIITEELLSKASTLPNINQDNIPALRGFVLANNGLFETRDIVESDQDLRNIANWGFNSVRLMVTYQTFFDQNADQVDLIKLKKLDAFIASAIKYNLHLDILTFTLPGRWRYDDFNTYETIGEFDLFTNPTRQKEANAIWAVLAERYKDVPSSVLSFTPIWEVQNSSLSSGLPVPPYTVKDVANVYSQVVGTILEHDPDRFIIFEPTAKNPAQDIINDSQLIKTVIQSKYSNTLMQVNFCELPFVYYDMTNASGANIDIQNHSMFKAAYPVMIYAAQFHLDKDTPLELNGSLIAGTKIELYLSKVDGSGTFTIMADGNTLYSEDLSTKNYRTDVPLSYFFSYAKSDKLVSVTLASDVESLQVSYSGRWFEWSGIDVTLPDSYAVERWWFSSGYDALLTGTEKLPPTLLDTSTIMIAPNSYDTGSQITINEDITYTSEAIFAQANQQTIEEWAKAIHDFSPILLVRFENAAFGAGGIHDSALQYYVDMLSTFNEYGMSWYSNDYYSITHAHYGFYAGIEHVYYKGRYIDIEMIKLLQKFQ
jgi:hypothetical protein